MRSPARSPTWLLLLAACGGPATPADSPLITEIMVSRSQYDSLPQLDLDPSHALCPTADSDVCLLRRNQTVVSDGHQLLLSYDLDRGDLHLIDAASLLDRPVGTRGEGPEEYRMVLNAAITPKSEIVAFDPAQRRLLRYSTNGTPISTVPAPMADGFITAGVVGGSLWQLASAQPSERGATDSTATAIFALAPDGTLHRRATLPVMLPARGLETMRQPAGIFAAADIFRIGSDGRIYFTTGRDFVISVYDTAGRPAMRIRVATEPRPVSDDEYSRERDRRLASAGAGPLGAAIRRTLGDRPARHPAITDLRPLENGDLWVRQAPDESGTQVEWLGFSSQGQPIGRLTTSVDTRILAALGPTIVVDLPPLQAATLTRR